MVIANNNTLFVAIAFVVMCALVVVRLIVGRNIKNDPSDDKSGSLSTLGEGQVAASTPA
jgi:flagellar biogenesis protein FliO